jgi:hypothetical protein
MSTKHIQLDPACETRFAWIAAYCRHVLNLAPAECRPTAILRRAIDAHVTHLERIIRLPDGHKDPTRDRDLANCVERMRLRDMLRDADLGVTPEEATALPLRCLSDYVSGAAATAAKPRALNLSACMDLDNNDNDNE